MDSLQMNGCVVALVGFPAAGKSTVARKLEESFGFNWIRTRDIVRELGAGEAVVSLQERGMELSSEEGVERFCEVLFSRIQLSVGNVIDAIRPYSHWRALENEFGSKAVLVGVQAAAQLRATRFAMRDPRSSLADRESHPVEREISSLLENATYILVNSDNLNLRVELLLTFLLRKGVLSPDFVTFAGEQDVRRSEATLSDIDSAMPPVS